MNTESNRRFSLLTLSVMLLLLPQIARGQNHAWRLVEEASLFSSVHDIRILSSGDLVALAQQIYTSSDGGENWIIRPVQFQGQDISFFAMDVGRTDSVFATTHSGQLFVSADGAQSFEFVRETGIPSLSDFIISGPTSLLATNLSGNIYRSLDFGKTWNVAAGFPLYGFQLHHGFSERQFVATGGGGLEISQGALLISEDYGASWNQVPLGDKGIAITATLSLEPDSLLLGTYEGPLIALNRTGTNIQSLFIEPEPGTIYQLKVDSSTGWMYAATSREVYRTENPHQSWEHLAPVAPARFAAHSLVILDDGSLIAGADPGIYKLSATHVAVEEEQPATRNALSITAIYPNPARSLISIVIESLFITDAHLEVFDLLGRRVYSDELKLGPGEDRHSINLPRSLPGGLYAITVSTKMNTVHSFFVRTKGP